MGRVREQLDLDEEGEAKLEALRKTINESIAEGGESTEEDLEILLADKMAELKRAGL